MKHLTTQKRKRRHKRIRSKVSGTAEKPRLAVFKSNKFIYAQLIDDSTHATLCASSDIKSGKGAKLDRATQVGKEIAEKAKEKNITTIVFDRGGFRFTGRVKALAQGARDNGLTF